MLNELPQAIVLDLGGEISAYPPIRAGDNPAVTVQNHRGTAIVPAATVATLDPVNTTLSAAAILGARELSVASAASIVSGRQYRVGPADPTTATGPHEFITVESISGTTLTLARPTRYAHANAAPLAGTRLSYTVTAAQADALFWDGIARWSWDSMPAYLQRFDTGVECVRSRLINLLTLEGWAAIDPYVHQLLPSEQDPQQHLDTAFNQVLLALGGKIRSHTLRSSDSLTRATATRASLNIRLINAADVEEIGRFTRAYDQSILDIQGWARDVNQDGRVEEHERGTSFWSVPLRRA